MALQIDGPISFDDIRAEMSISTSFALDDILTARRVFRVDPPYSVQDFYGKSINGAGLEVNHISAATTDVVYLQAMASTGISSVSFGGVPANTLIESPYPASSTSFTGKYTITLTTSLIKITTNGTAPGVYTVTIGITNDSAGYDEFPLMLTVS